MKYLAGRLIQAIPVMLVASLVIFWVIRLVPGDPAYIYAGSDPTPDVLEAVRVRYGLDQPWYGQYFHWLTNVFQGDLGHSYRTQEPVVDIITRAVPATIWLAVATMVFALLYGIVTGVLAAVRPRSVLDYVIQTANSVALGVPNFWLGILLVLGLVLYLGLFPSGGFVSPLEDPLGALRSVALPAVALGMRLGAVVSRFLRSSLLEVMDQDYIRTARAKGAHELTVIFRHGFRNALLPLITVVGVEAGRLLGGSVVVEAVFSWPGLGRTVLLSVLNRDYVLLQSVLLVLVFTFLAINLLTDLMYGVADPRIRLAAGKGEK